MTLKFLVMAGGLLALVAAGAAARFKRIRSARITTEHVSGDWLAEARAKEDHPW